MITKKLIEEVRDFKETRKLSITQIARLTGKGRSTIYKILKEKLNYVPSNRLVKQIQGEPRNEEEINEAD